ncbi:MAG: hypothetical protein M0D54_11890 [Hyphomonadaceae bacterium JAD_PAG50586_4]|nr:MAG: hypothetical protein M0D54_11890 [Hyphomonadaceae bacterium JAD_PAG50586_4]
MRYNPIAGFTTLEVIAAIAIIAIALVPIMTLQGELARHQARLTQVQDRATATHNSLALLRDINPMATPAGQRRLDERTILTWTSVAISPARRTVNPAGFDAQLYRVSAIIERDAQTLSATEIELIGWRRLGEAQ